MVSCVLHHKRSDVLLVDAYKGSESADTLHV